MKSYGDGETTNMGTAVVLVGRIDGHLPPTVFCARSATDGDSYYNVFWFVCSDWVFESFGDFDVRENFRIINYSNFLCSPYRDERSCSTLANQQRYATDCECDGALLLDTLG